MENSDITARDIMAKEGLGLFAFELETLHPDLGSASLSKLLATVINETSRLPDWCDQNSERVSAAKKCHRLALELTNKLSASEEVNYSSLLVIGYLYGRLTLPSRDVQRELYEIKRVNEGLDISKKNRESGLTRSNEFAAAFNSYIKRVARELWANDVEKNLRINDVYKIIKPKAQYAKEKLLNKGIKSAIRLPESEENLKKIIKEVAPKYASRPGAPRKNNP